MKKILVIAAHPDDEILGCGGAMSKWIRQGHQVKVVIAAEGLTSREDDRKATDHAELEELKMVAIKANNCLGVKDIVFLNFPDNRMDQLDLLDVIKPLERVIQAYAPEVIYTHHIDDLNIDHSILNRAVVTACRPLPTSSIREIYFFEVLSASHWNITTSIFRTTAFEELSAEDLACKLAALEVYAGEMRPFPHARSLEAVKALAVVRGSLVGKRAAEAFETFRQLR